MSGYEVHTTNNRMELMGPIQALTALKRPCEVVLYTDSAYVCNAFTNGWIKKWQQNNWQTSKKTPVENQDLWRKLLDLLAIHNAKWVKVKGHSDNERNNKCDLLARTAIKQGLAADN